MTTPQFTPQKSYRDLVEGEPKKLGDEYLLGCSWHKINSDPQSLLWGECVRRPIHRQPDGSWRDEGEEISIVSVIELAREVQRLCNASSGKVDWQEFVARGVLEYLGIPLEPEQEEWEKAFDEVYKGIPLDQEAMLQLRGAFKVAFLKGQAHERKQGEKK